MLVVSDKRLFLDKKGRVVTEDDPTQVSLLVGQGAEIEEDILNELGCSYQDGKVIIGEALKNGKSAQSLDLMEYTRPIFPRALGKLFRKFLKK